MSEQQAESALFDTLSTQETHIACLQSFIRTLDCLLLIGDSDLTLSMLDLCRETARTIFEQNQALQQIRFNQEEVA